MFSIDGKFAINIPFGGILLSKIIIKSPCNLWLWSASKLAVFGTQCSQNMIWASAKTRTIDAWPHQ